MNLRAVTLTDAGGKTIAHANVAEADGLFSGTADLSAMPADVLAVFDEFEQIVKDWFATARHPTTGRPYTEMAYQPMLELLAYLRANDFKTFIVSGSGIEFMRAFAEKVYGIPPEQVIGSSGKQQFEMRVGKPVIVKLAAGDFIDDKDGKPIAIQKVIGRRPIAAFGNSDGDLQMLQWTCAASRTRSRRSCRTVRRASKTLPVRSE